MEFGDLNDKLAVFANGGGGYLCVDGSHVDPEQSLVWWNDQSPEVSPFWATLDAWMEVGLTD